jgi:hypothetical protein
MKNKWIILAAAVAVTALTTAQAVPITGAIDMSGTATVNSLSLAAATAATSLTGVAVTGGPTGAFAGTFGSVVAWNGFTWPGGSASPLWTFTASGVTYTFALATDSVANQSNTFLNLLGSGTLTATGYDPTPGLWSFTISNPSGAPGANFQFSFANSQTAVVPDGGATVMLLGAALSALGLFRKKLIA